jgi:hypothetical protein
MNPYAAPGTVSTGMEDEVAAAVPTPLVRVSGGVIALAGARGRRSSPSEGAFFSRW